VKRTWRWLGATLVLIPTLAGCGIELFAQASQSAAGTNSTQVTASANTTAAIPPAGH
jgi:hypothetical protein